MGKLVYEAYKAGSAKLEPFMEGIEQYVREAVGKVGAATSDNRPSTTTAPTQRQPEEGTSLLEMLECGFGFSSFRPNQEAVCQAAIEGQDVLLVMPTGSGKSLCYQLPGMARGGTTLVISPLIALIEDQVSKLKDRGFAVERIHSGLTRATSRQVCFGLFIGQAAVSLHCAGAASGSAAFPKCWPSASPR